MIKILSILLKTEIKLFNGYIEKNKKQIPQNFLYRCGLTHSNYSLKKIGKTFELQKKIVEN